MQKIYVFFFLGLVILLGGLNFGLYKYNEADKAVFFQRLKDHFLFYCESSHCGIGYLTKDFDPSTGEWSLDWIKRDSFLGVGDEQKPGITIMTVQLDYITPEFVDGKFVFDKKSSSRMAYEWVTGPATTPDSPFMIHSWTYTINPPDIESILATESSFYKLEKNEFAWPNLSQGGPIIIDSAVLKKTIKSKYVRTPNGNFLVLLIFANVLLILIYSFVYFNALGSKIKKIKGKEKEKILDKSQDLWHVLERKCNPQKYMSPYNKEMVDKANSIYAELQKTDKSDEISLKEIRRRIESELHISFIDKDEIESLKYIVNPSNYMQPYNAEKVAFANELYAKLQDETIHIDELDSIKEQLEKLKF